VLLDQTRLPGERRENIYADWHDLVGAIRAMVVRGAPAIGIAAAYGTALAARQGRDVFDDACDGLAAARPTAVNLAWAIGRMRTAAAAAGDACGRRRQTTRAWRQFWRCSDHVRRHVVSAFPRVRIDQHG